MSYFVTAAEGARHTVELPLHPYAIGAIILVIQLLAVLAVLSMGKGRTYKQ